MTSPADRLPARYEHVRRFTEALCETLAPEDMVVQSMEDVSPTKWHLAHTSWFFETFLLAPRLPGYRLFHPQFGYLFNSYYQQVGRMHPRPQRGLLSRPTVADVKRYRAHVDAGMARLLETEAGRASDAVGLVELGLNHEQQHQELLLTDIKHVFSMNPLHPALREDAAPSSPHPAPPMRWLGHEGGLVSIGHEGDGFAYDNEGPRHAVFLLPFELASRPVTQGEYLAFMADGAYERPELWLSDGWNTLGREGWRAPAYWTRRDDGWWQHTLGGLRPVDPEAPVCHLSYYEADAYARWAGARLPLEAEWEVLARTGEVEGRFADDGALHPLAASDGPGLRQAFGDVWEWTASPYVPYPGYRTPEGAVGEYNGKFMVDQQVLRGGSCATPRGHVRPTYRNFFPAAARWQFTGLRLARDAQ